MIFSFIKIFESILWI